MGLQYVYIQIEVRHDTVHKSVKVLMPQLNNIDKFIGKIVVTAASI